MLNIHHARAQAQDARPEEFRPVDPRVGIGHVHLKVADIPRSLAFYGGVLGLELYWDRPAKAWPRTPDGGLAMYTRRLDLPSLLREGVPEAGG